MISEMKRIVLNCLFITALLVGALASCGEKENEMPTSSVSVINAKILYDNDYDDMISVVKLLVNSERIHDPDNRKYIWQGVEVARGDYRNGGFTINLPENVDNLKPFDLELPPKAKISKKNVLYANSIFIAYDKDDEQVGYFYYIHFLQCEETIVESALFYFDRDFTITGSGTEDDGSLWSFACNFKNGWNILYGINSRTSDGNSSLKMTTAEPDCMYWSFRNNDRY